MVNRFLPTKAIFRPILPIIGWSVIQWCIKPYLTSNTKTEQKNTPITYYDVALPAAQLLCSSDLFKSLESFPFKTPIAKIINHPILIHVTPIAFRALSATLQFQQPTLCSKQNHKLTIKSYTFVKDYVLRALEFTSWYQLANLHSTKFVTHSDALSLINKLAAIYTIKGLDILETKWIQNATQTFALPNATKFITLPLTKSPVTTICKLVTDTIMPSSLSFPIKLGLDTTCNFLGEASYKTSELFFENNHQVNLTQFTNAIPYLISKAFWKSMHQSEEKHFVKLTSNPTGYYSAATVFPRAYLTNKLKSLFNTQDSSDYLDPNLHEIQKILGLEINVNTLPIENIILNAKYKGTCPDINQISSTFLNVTDHFLYVEKSQQQEAVRCTLETFYSPDNLRDTLELLQNQSVSQMKINLHSQIHKCAAKCLEPSQS